MPQSLTRVYLHLIFHTKNKYVSIRPSESNKLYAYMNGVIKNNESIPIIINGVSDHIHILCVLSKNVALARLVQKIKQNSSRWLKEQDRHYRNFEWQGGYGGFSVSPSILDKTIGYIKNQQDHHKKRSFREEYRSFLQTYKIEYNEKYLWDE